MKSVWAQNSFFLDAHKGEAIQAWASNACVALFIIVNMAYKGILLKWLLMNGMDYYTGEYRK